MRHVFGTDGVRDRAGEGLLATAEVRRLARAIGTLLRRDRRRFSAKIPKALRHLGGSGPTGTRVLVGRDTRPSGPEIEDALVEGLTEVGIDVVRTGILTTPGVSFLTRAWRCVLGVAISASHNPAEDNGIKLFSPEGLKLPDAAEAAIEKLLARRFRAPRGRGRVADASAGTSEYVEFLARFSRPLRGLRIAVDCAEGAASAFAGPLLERLGARPILLNAAGDGARINKDSGALHPGTLAAAVLREEADVGVAFDGDADRAIFADDKGEARDGDHVLALCAAHLKEKGALPRDMVVSTVMANFGLERFLAERGIALRRTPVGDRFVAEELFRAGAILGGEPSGHVLFLDAAPTGDGLLTMLRVLDTLAERGERLSRLALPKCPQVLLNVPVRHKPPLGNIASVRAAIEAARRSLAGRGRLVVRYSGTESVCRVMVEGRDARRVGRLARDLANVVAKELA